MWKTKQKRRWINMMDGDNYKVHAYIEVIADCPSCGETMFQLFTLLGKRDTYICPKCKNAYKLKLVKLPNKQIDKRALAEVIKEHKANIKPNEKVN